MNTCGTCKFKGATLTRQDDDCEDIETGYFLCQRIKFLDTYNTKEIVDCADKSFVIDGSGYYAALCVGSDFGCNEHQPA